MNTLQKQFSDALKREKKFVTTYYNNETVPCLFRKIDDNKNTSNHIQIFYDIDSPIKQGQIITYGDKHFIVINKENIGSNAYYKSTLKECNMTIPVSIKGTIKQIPCYSYELSSAYNIANNIITFLDGKGELLTELIPELSATNYVDKGLRIMGGYFKIANVYNLDGIVHLMIMKDLAPSDTYSFTLTSDTNSYIEGDTTQLTALAMINDDVEDTTATITYSSSDETIATVDDNGLVTFIRVGNTTITATWVEKELTDTVDLLVSADPNAKSYTITITQSGELTVGGVVRTFYPTLRDNTGTVIPFPTTPVWTFDYNGMPTSDFTITYDGNNCKIKVKENYDILGMTLRVICTTADGKWTGYIDAVVTVY